MSSFPTAARSRPVRQRTPAARPRLTVVQPPAVSAPRVPFVALVVVVLAVGLVGLLVLNTSLQRGAYVLTDLRTQEAQLALREQNLQTQVGELSSPERLAAVAAASGMVRGDSPAFLSLRTGKVVGMPKPGKRENSVALYGGSVTGPTTKLNPPVAGSFNSASIGLQDVMKARGHRHQKSKASATADRSAR